VGAWEAAPVEIVIQLAQLLNRTWGAAQWHASTWAAPCRLWFVL